MVKDIPFRRRHARPPRAGLQLLHWGLVLLLGGCAGGAPAPQGSVTLTHEVELVFPESGYDYVPYASLERIVEENKASYYAAVRASQLEMREDSTGFGDWLMFFLRALHVQQQNLAAKLEIERSMQQLSATQTAILAEIDRLGRVTSTIVAERLDLPPRTVRYHLQTLIRQGLVEPQGEKRGRTYRRASGESPGNPIHGPDSPTAAILAAILEAGGTIRAGDLKRLVKKHGYDPRVVGTCTANGWRTYVVSGEQVRASSPLAVARSPSSTCSCVGWGGSTKSQIRCAARQRPVTLDRGRPYRVFFEGDELPA